LIVVAIGSGLPQFLIGATGVMIMLPNRNAVDVSRNRRAVRSAGPGASSVSQRRTLRSGRTIIA
jgi:hypothetical protein